MKKIYLAFFTILTGLSINAQTLTQANHAPVSGDQYSNFQCDSTAILPGASGTGVTWNYSTLVIHTGIANNYSTSVSTSTSYPAADIAVYSSTANINYFKSSATDLNFYGGNINIGAVNATLNYTSPAIYAKYPMSLATTGTSNIGGTIAAFSNNGSFSGNSSVVADGTGTLVLPARTFTNVMRVVTTQTINFTVILPGTALQVTYDYYSGSLKTPVFSIVSSTLTSSLGNSNQSYVYVAKNYSTVGVKENKQTLIELAVYPNPSSSNLNFVTESNEAKQVLIYDITGKLVEKQNFIDGKLKLDVSNYNTGLYMYTVIGNANQTLKSGKVTVSH